jgi:hypothetical protein
MAIHQSSATEMAQMHDEIIAIFKTHRISREDAFELLKSVMFDVLHRDGFRSDDIKKPIENMVIEYQDFCKHMEQIG